MKREAKIDLLRVMAILLVTGFHVWRFVGRPHQAGLGFDLYAPFEKGPMGVTIFVFISGYLGFRSLNRLGRWSFFKRRLARLYLPYVVALVVWNILVSHGIAVKTHSFWDNLTHLTFTHNLFQGTFFSISGVFWYMALQVQLYVIACLLWPQFRKWPLRTLALTAAISLALTWGFPTLGGFVANRSALVFLPVFLLGAVMSQRNLTGWPQAILLWIAAILYSLHPPLAMPGRLDLIINALLLCLAVTTTPAISSIPRGVLLPVRFVATISFSVYLYNYIFQCFTPRLDGIAGLIIYMGIAIFFGAGMWALVELPWQRILGKRIKTAAEADSPGAVSENAPSAR